MVERRLSLPWEIKEKYFKVGVVIFIFNQKGEILLVRENSANATTGKEPGNFGVICETSYEDEGCEKTTIRGLKEELGIDVRIRSDSFKIDPKNCFLGESLFMKGILARVITVHWRGDPNELLSAKGDGEVTPICWERPDNLHFYPLRIGVRNVLQECLEEGCLREVYPVSETNLVPLSITSLKKAVEDS